MFRTSNPALNNPAFKPAQTWDDYYGSRAGMKAATLEKPAKAVRADHMTISGTVQKGFICLFLCLAAALVAWNVSLGAWSVGVSANVLMFGGMISGLILCVVWCLAPKTAPITVPLYALAEGLFVGGISAWYAARFAKEGSMLNTGLVLNASLLTFGIFGGLLAGYGTGIIRPGPWFRKAVITATIGVMIYGVVALLAGMFLKEYSLMSVFDPSNGGPLSIGVSLFLVVVASANFVLDFEFIENGAANKAPRYYEWVGAGGLLVTMVWLYLELLRLLAKIQSRD